jgi:CTP synthase (UTP-ammonia lyase)
MAYDFSIANILSEIGVSVTVIEITNSLNDWGDATETETEHTGSTASLQFMDGSDDEVKEGIMDFGDIQAFFDEEDTNAAYLSNGNKLKYNNNKYKIYNVIQPLGYGHYEVHATKE